MIIGSTSQTCPFPCTCAKCTTCIGRFNPSCSIPRRLVFCRRSRLPLLRRGWEGWPRPDPDTREPECVLAGVQFSGTARSRGVCLCNKPPRARCALLLADQSLPSVALVARCWLTSHCPLLVRATTRASGLTSGLTDTQGRRRRACHLLLAQARAEQVGDRRGEADVRRLDVAVHDAT